MRRIRYQVACSLDGFIAGAEGEYDWITEDPDIDFAELYDQFDTFLMGRKTYQELQQYISESGWFRGKEIVVFSSSLRPEDHRDVRIVADGADEVIAELRSRTGKDIWLFGGGELFRSLLEGNHVDTVETAVIPVLLGRGRRLLPHTEGSWRLELAGQRVYEKSGIVLLEYRVSGALKVTNPVG